VQDLARRRTRAFGSARGERESNVDGPPVWAFSMPRTCWAGLPFGLFYLFYLNHDRQPIFHREFVLSDLTKPFAFLPPMFCMANLFICDSGKMS
jgi:hypothetical protein